MASRPLLLPMMRRRSSGRPETIQARAGHRDAALVSPWPRDGGAGLLQIVTHGTRGRGRQQHPARPAQGPAAAAQRASRGRTRCSVLACGARRGVDRHRDNAHSLSQTTARVLGGASRCGSLLAFLVSGCDTGALAAVHGCARALSQRRPSRQIYRLQYCRQRLPADYGHPLQYRAGLRAACADARRVYTWNMAERLSQRHRGCHDRGEPQRCHWPPCMGRPKTPT